MVVRRGNRIDTLRRKLIEQYETDSFFIVKYLEDWEYYQGKILDEVIVIERRFPKDTSTNTLEFGLVSLDSIRFEGKYYKIYKYYENPDITDAFMLYFYSPQFGVLIDRSVSWGTYSRYLYSDIPENDPTIFFLTEKIISDEKYFKGYPESPPDLTLYYP
jgi:hypothetical protein